MANYYAESMPEVEKLFAQLSRNEMPNFLELMAAINDISNNSHLPDGGGGATCPETQEAPKADAQDEKSSCCDPFYPQNRPCSSC